MKNTLNPNPVVDFDYNLRNVVHFNPNYFLKGSKYQTPKYFMLVENTPEGRDFYESFKQKNKDKFKIRVRGRAKNRRQVMQSLGRVYNPVRSDGNDLAIKGSERFGVYLYTK